MNTRIRLTRRLHHAFRRVKAHLLVHRTPVVTGLFFRSLGWMERRLSGRRRTEGERLADMLWKAAYLARWPDGSGVTLVTDHPVAIRSDDHLFPRGTALDNSRNARFNARLYELLGFRRGLRLLDLGCSGGGLVRSYLEDGHLGVGLEGSDLSRRTRSGEWDTIPHHLFTCDITRPFALTGPGGGTIAFDAVTAWEVFEHIPEADVGPLMANIRAHLAPGGWFIGSIDLLPDGNPLTGAVYHRTLRPREWWHGQFAAAGFEVLARHPFAPEDMVRGNGLSFKDWYPREGCAMHVVARRVG